MNRLLFKNARIVNEGQVVEGDVLVVGERIERTGGTIEADADRTIDVNGRYLMPGMIDDQVHFREPGLTHKGDVATESAAAVAGGITSFMEMPNTDPRTVTLEALEEKHAMAAGRSAANYSFYLGATNTNLEQVQRLDPNTAAGIKIFMGASTGNMLVDNAATLDAIFRDAPTIVTTHCEDTPTIVAETARAHERFGKDIPPGEHPVIRSEEACYRSSSMAVELAKRHGTRLHVLHLTTEKELELFAAGPIESKTITVEVCAHHLYFSAKDYATRGNRIKCNPAIKYESDRLALLKALEDDRIDVIATDHAPHLPAEKDGLYDQAAAGLPLVEQVIPSLFRHVHDGHLSLTNLVHKTSHAVAKRFEVVDRGFIREGFYADLIIVDPDARPVVDETKVFAKCGWSPFAGDTMMASVDCTVVNGHVVFEDGKVTQTDRGQRLQYCRG